MPREGHNPTHFHWYFCTKQTFLLKAVTLCVINIASKDNITGIENPEKDF